MSLQARGEPLFAAQGKESEMRRSYPLFVLIAALMVLTVACAIGPAEQDATSNSIDALTEQTGVQETLTPETQTSAPTAPTGAAPPEDSLDSTLSLCSWFMEAQTIRAERVAAMTLFVEWFQENGPDGAFAEEGEVVAELVDILAEFQPHQREFVQEWRRLGTHPGGTDFWENELRCVEMRIEAFDEMIAGFYGTDMEQYYQGATIFAEASQYGHKAEESMLDIEGQCSSLSIE